MSVRFRTVITIAFWLFAAAAQAEDLVSVRFSTLPEGARVFVNGVERGITPTTLSLPSGSNEFFLYKEGFLPVRKSVQWAAGERPNYREPLRTQRGGLIVLADPPGAKVFLDQRPLGTAPIAYENIQAGFYQVEVRRDGFKPFVATLEINDVRPRTVNVRLEGPPVLLFVEGDAGSRVYLDGSYAGEITQDSLIVKARAGTHEVRIERNGFASVQNILLEPGRDAVIGMGELKMLPRAQGGEVIKVNPRWYLVAASVGAAVAGGVVAGVGAYAANQARSDYETAWRRSDIADARDAIRRNNVFFAVGAGIFGAGVAGAVLAWPGSDSLSVTAGPAGIGLQARFP